jgi:uncharacterized protein (UPF0261 family)
MNETVAILGTMDTKGTEFGFLQQLVLSSGLSTLVLDAGVLGPPALRPDVTSAEVARLAGADLGQLIPEKDRGRSVEIMAAGARLACRRLFEEGKIDGLISLGGSAGTTIGAAAMRALPVGFPKVMVSTLASGDTRRLEAAGKRGIPQVVCPGAIDMVNFDPMDTVPERFKHRTLYAHNPNVTLMRTTPEECAELARITAEKLNRAQGPIEFVVPLRGVSTIDAAGQPFHSPEATAAYLGALKRQLDPRIPLVEVDANLNDPNFASEVAKRLLDHLTRE